MVDSEEDVNGAAAAMNGTDASQASQSTFATVDPRADHQDSHKTIEQVEDDLGLHEESSSNVLFHPPAAHEEHSEDSDNEDSHVELAASTAVATNHQEESHKASAAGEASSE